MKEFLKTTLPVLIFTILIFVFVFVFAAGFSIYYEKNYCKTMQEAAIDYNFQWRLWGGCMVETPSGYWVNAKDYVQVGGFEVELK